ncbi:facilitated trehalose transporter Tret1-like [Planococcus citri]|uniref:facilitated trehalose transporter Tret1-like n=1 Tax=Planococcus citri TaxID=170843 RepID=UPI0031F9A167
MANLADEKKIKRDGIRQVISCIVVFLPVMCGGIASGWSSPTEKYLRNMTETWKDCPELNTTASGSLTEEEFSWVTSVLYFGGMAGCLIWNPITETFGRKIAGYIVGLLQTSAWAGILYKTDFKILLICRFLLGVSVSGGLVVGMSYTNEITSARLKGPMSSLGAIFLNGGFLVVYLCGSFFPYNVLNTICLSFPIAFLLMFFKLPESPLYLLMDNQEQRAKESFMWFRGNKEHKVGKEMAAIQASPAFQSRVSFKDLFTSRSTTASVIIAMMLLSGQQISGITIITSYTELIFGKSGNKISPSFSTVIMGLIQIFGCCIPGLLVNRVNQKLLLVISYVLAAMSLFGVGVAFSLLERGYDSNFIKTLPFIGVLCYILSFTTGIANVPFIIFTRIFEPKVMSLAMSYGQLAGSITAFLTAKLFFTLTDNLKYSGTFYFLGSCCIIMAMYVMKFIDVGRSPLPRKQEISVHIEDIEKSKQELIVN